MRQVLFLTTMTLLFMHVWTGSQSACPPGQLWVQGTCSPPFYIEGCATYCGLRQCQQCEYGYSLAQGRCVPSSQQQQCCAAYAADGSCSSCSLGLYSQQPYCYRNEIYGCVLKKANKCQACASGLTLSNGVCRVEVSGCSQYSSLGVCVGCQQGFKLVQGYCYQWPVVVNCQKEDQYGCIECSQGYYLTANRTCIAFQAGCIKYWQQQCVSCHSRFSLQNGRCSIQGCKRYNIDCCAECLSGYQLSQGKCFYNGCERTVNNVCLSCLPGLRLTQQGCSPVQDYSCAQCSPGFTFINRQCRRAIPGCQQYSSTGQCAACRVPFQLTVNGQCQILGCSTYSEEGCQKCLAPFTVQNGVCVVANCKSYSQEGCVECESNYLLAQGQCYSKDKNCISYDSSQGQPVCTKCVQRYYLWQGTCRPSQRGCLYDSTGTCKCRSGFSQREGKCEIIGCKAYDWETCLSCIQPFSYNPQTRTCFLDSCLEYSWTCCTKCQSGFTLTNGVCRAAVPYCLSYSNQGRCQACQQGFTLSSTGSCLKNIPNCASLTSDGLNCQQCKDTYTLYKGECRVFQPSCSQMDFEKGLCVCCVSGYYLLNGKCKEKEQNCLTYTSSNGNEFCSKCKVGFYLNASQNKCIAEQFGCVYLDNQCVGCCKPFTYDSAQSSCFVPGCQKYCAQGCLACASPFTLNNGLCTIPYCSQYSRDSCSRCQSGYALTNSGICVQIDPNCLAYQGSACTKCKEGMILRQGQCVINDPNCIAYGQNGLICTSCNQGYFLDSTGKCQPQQPGCLYTQGCCSSCRTPFVHNPQLKTCQIANCLKLVPEGCSQCRAPFMAVGGACVLQNCLRNDGKGCIQCKSQYHLKEGGCVANDANCLIYSASTGLCELCANQYSLNSEGKCIQGDGACQEYCSSSPNKCLLCGPEYYLNQFFQCEKKDSNCEAYTNGFCSKCKPKFFLYSQICFPYTIGCVAYQGKSCTSCKNGYVLKNGECFRWDNQGMALLGGDDRYDFDITPIDVRQSKYYINNLSPSSAIGTFFFSSTYDATFKDCSLSTLEGATGKGWKAQLNDQNQYIGVTISGEPATFYALQLEAVGGFYPKQFYLEYSVDGKQFTRVQSEFQVPTSVTTNLTTIYFTGIYAQAIRIRIVKSQGWPACRIEFFYYDMLRFRKISNLKSLTYLQETINSNFVDRVDNQIYINQVYFFNPAAACSIQEMCFTGLTLCEPKAITALTLTFDDPKNWVKNFYLTYTLDGRKYNCYQNCRKFQVTSVNSNSFQMSLEGLQAQGVRIYPTDYQGSPKFSPTFFYN